MTTPTVGQFTVSPLAGVHAAASQIATTTQPPAQKAGLDGAYRQGTVVSVQNGPPPTCTVTFDGSTNVAGVGFMGSYFPTVNDTVVCVALGGATWILGSLAVSRTLTVPALTSTGVTTLSGGVSGNTTFNDDITVTGNVTGDTTFSGNITSHSRDLPLIVGSSTSGITYLADETPPICLCFGSVTVNFAGTTSARSGNINAGFTNITGGVGACNITNNVAAPGVPVNIGTSVFQMQYTTPGNVAAGNRGGYFLVWGN